MALEMRSKCERCATPLAQESDRARICSYEWHLLRALFRRYGRPLPQLRWRTSCHVPGAAKSVKQLAVLTRFGRYPHRGKLTIHLKRPQNASTERRFMRAHPAEDCSVHETAICHPGREVPFATSARHWLYYRQQRTLPERPGPEQQGGVIMMAANQTAYEGADSGISVSAERHSGPVRSMFSTRRPITTSIPARSMRTTMATGCGAQRSGGAGARRASASALITWRYLLDQNRCASFWRDLIPS